MLLTSSAAFFFSDLFFLLGLLTKLHSSISSLICPGHMLQSVASLCKHPYQLLHRDGRPATKAQMWQCHPVKKEKERVKCKKLIHSITYSH